MNFPGTQILHTLCSQLSWFSQCLRLTQTFPDDPVLSTLRRELTWSHLKSLTLLPSRETLQAKLHQSIELARARLNRNDAP